MSNRERCGVLLLVACAAALGWNVPSATLRLPSGDRNRPAAGPGPSGSPAAARGPPGPAPLLLRPEPPDPAAPEPGGARRKRFPAHGLFEPAASRPTPQALRCRPAAAAAEGAAAAGPLRQECLPLALGISCVHCGSSSLAKYLNAHPMLSYAGTKEHHFFPHPAGRDPLASYSKQFRLPVRPTTLPRHPCLAADARCRGAGGPADGLRPRFHPRLPRQVRPGPSRHHTGAPTTFLPTRSGSNLTIWL